MDYKNIQLLPLVRQVGYWKEKYWNSNSETFTFAHECIVLPQTLTDECSSNIEITDLPELLSPSSRHYSIKSVPDLELTDRWKGF